MYTMFFVILLWVLFRADNLSQAAGYIGAMFGISAAGFMGDTAMAFLSHNWLLFVVGVIGCIPVIPMLRKKIPGKIQEWLVAVAMLAVFILCIMALVTSDYNPFIYFNF